MNEVKLEMIECVGSFCSNGETGLNLLVDVVKPAIEKENRVIFDFTGVRSVNSSFSNALFGNIIKRYGRGVLKQITVSNANTYVQNEVKAAFLMKSNLQETVPV